MKQGWIAEAIDRLIADATAGDEGVLARARVFAFEDYPRELGESFNAADRERLFHSLEVLLAAHETATRAHVEAAASAAAERARADLLKAKAP
jgi:hypothetical protein